MLLALTMVLGLLIGSGMGFAGSAVDVTPAVVFDVLRWKTFGGPMPDRGLQQIVWEIRLPQVLLASCVGAALSVSGSIFQTTLRNPLADPLLLGVAAGASLAASIVIALGLGGAAPPIAASLGAGLTLLFVFGIAGRRGRFDPGTMVLAGVIASTFYSAVTLFILAVIPSQTISTILKWTMGGFADVGFVKVQWAGPALVALCVATMAGVRPLNLLLLGDDAARSSGLAVGPARAIFYAFGAALTGVSVAAAGVVGFVGLVVPHVARRLFGADQRVALPASALLGAILCVLADAVARVAVPLAQLAASTLRGAPPQPSYSELPVGVVTALFGAPFFLWLLVRRSERGGV